MNNNTNIDRHLSDPLGSSPAQLCSFYIDAFNLYHSLVDLIKYESSGLLLNNIPNLHKIKWCNLRLLCEYLLRNNANCIIKDIYFFTAIPSHRPQDQINRHNQYCRILSEICKINIINGKFSHGNEKQTDVNLAVHVLSDVLLKKVHSVYIISNDSDIIPIINKVKEYSPRTNINIIKPPSAKYIHHKKDGTSSIYETTQLSFDIKKAMDWYYDGKFNRIRELKPLHLLDRLLDDKITLQDGTIIKNPYI